MTEQQTIDLESQLSAMSEREVLRFYQPLEVDDLRLDVTAGELERRNIDL